MKNDTVSSPSKCRFKAAHTVPRDPRLTVFEEFGIWRNPMDAVVSSPMDTVVSH